MAARSLTIAELKMQIQRHEKRAEKLEVKRDRLAKQLRGIEDELASIRGKSSTARRGSGARHLGRAAPARGRRRTRNKVNLPDAIAESMERGAVVSPKEAAALVIRNGYQTMAKNFNVIVTNALSKDTRFKRVSRGQYKRLK